MALVNPDGVPDLSLRNLDAVDSAGAKLQTAGTGLQGTGRAVASKFGKLSGVYKAPEAADLFTSIEPARKKSWKFGSDINQVGVLLEMYATNVRPLKEELIKVKAEAREFRKLAQAQTARSEHGDFDDALDTGDFSQLQDWDEIPWMVAKNNHLASELTRLITEILDWQVDTANMIEDLIGGMRWNSKSYRKENVLVDDSGEESGEPPPWGGYEELDVPFYEDVWNLAVDAVDELTTLIPLQPVLGELGVDDMATWQDTADSWEGVVKDLGALLHEIPGVGHLIDAADPELGADLQEHWDNQIGQIAADWEDNPARAIAGGAGLVPIGLTRAARGAGRAARAVGGRGRAARDAADGARRAGDLKVGIDSGDLDGKVNIPKVGDVVNRTSNIPRVGDDPDTGPAGRTGDRTDISDRLDGRGPDPGPSGRAPKPGDRTDISDRLDGRRPDPGSSGRAPEPGDRTQPGRRDEPSHSHEPGRPNEPGGRNEPPGQRPDPDEPGGRHEPSKHADRQEPGEPTQPGARRDPEGRPEPGRAPERHEPTRPTQLTHPTGRHEPSHRPDQSEPGSRHEPSQRPNDPDRRPDEPSHRPDSRSHRPDEPTHKPDEPTHKPDQPTHKSDEPTHKPDQPTHKSDQPTHKPDEPTHRPDQPAHRPDQPAHQPSHTREPAVTPPPYVPMHPAGAHRGSGGDTGSASPRTGRRDDGPSNHPDYSDPSYRVSERHRAEFREKNRMTDSYRRELDEARERLPEDVDLHPEELDALNREMTSVHLDTRPAMRDRDQGALAEHDALIRNAVSGLNKFPDYHGPVHRGIQVEAKDLDAFLDRHQQGRTVRDPAIVSADKSGGYPGNVQMHIQSKYGKDISSIRSHSGNQEVAWGPDNNFEVTNRRYDEATDTWHIDLADRGRGPQTGDAPRIREGSDGQVGDISSRLDGGDAQPSRRPDGSDGHVGDIARRLDGDPAGAKHTRDTTSRHDDRPGADHRTAELPDRHGRRLTDVDRTSSPEHHFGPEGSRPDAHVPRDHLDPEAEIARFRPDREPVGRAGEARSEVDPQRYRPMDSEGRLQRELENAVGDDPLGNVHRWQDKLNPHFGKGWVEFRFNCSAVVRAAADTIQGTPRLADGDFRRPSWSPRPAPGDYDHNYEWQGTNGPKQMHVWDGRGDVREFTDQAYREIAGDLHGRPAGTVAAVCVHWNHGGGHWFVGAVDTDGSVKWGDFQPTGGRFESWPPTYQSPANRVEFTVREPGGQWQGRADWKSRTSWAHDAHDAHGAPGSAEDPAARLQQNAQGKHQFGHRQYIRGRSFLGSMPGPGITDTGSLDIDPSVLAERAGTGVPVNPAIARGEPGFKERVDFGEVIGTHVQAAGTVSLETGVHEVAVFRPTTNAIFAYKLDGTFHIIPARP